MNIFVAKIKIQELLIAQNNFIKVLNINENIKYMFIRKLFFY
jgi:hypothetical protein